MNMQNKSLFLTTMYPSIQNKSVSSRSDTDLSRLIQEVKKAQIQVDLERKEINTLLNSTRYTKEKIERFKTRQVKNTSFRNVANSLVKTLKYNDKGKFLF